MISIEEALRLAEEKTPGEEIEDRLVVVKEEPIGKDEVSASTEAKVTDVLKLTFRTSRNFTKEMIGSFKHPLFILKVSNDQDIMNWVNQKLADYACARTYYPKLEWYDFIVPDQFQDKLGCQKISIEGDLKYTVIRKLITIDG